MIKGKVGCILNRILLLGFISSFLSLAWPQKNLPLFMMILVILPCYTTTQIIQFNQEKDEDEKKEFNIKFSKFCGVVASLILLSIFILKENSATGEHVAILSLLFAFALIFTLIKMLVSLKLVAKESFNIAKNKIK